MNKKIFGFIFGVIVIFVSIFTSTTTIAALTASIIQIPNEGEIGKTIIIKGENLTPINKVFVGVGEVGVMDIHPKSDKEVSIVIPPSATTGKIKIETQNNGTAISATNFTIVSLSSINLSIKNITSNSADVVFKEDVSDRPYTGTIINKNDIQDHKSLPATLDQIVNGVVTMKATGLKPGTAYIVKITNREEISTEISFTTLGNSDAPIIIDFSPLSGRVKDTVVIKGYNLLLSNVDDIYFYDMIQTSGVVSHDPSTGQTLVSVKVPEGAKNGKITLNTLKGAVSTSIDFTVTSTDKQEDKLQPSIGGSTEVNANGQPIKFTGLVPDCNTGAIDGETGHYKNPCDFNYFMALINRLIKFLLFDIATPFVALIIMYTGYLFLTAGGSAGQTEKAKHILLNVVIGYVIALAAWLIITAIISIFGVTDSSIGMFLSGFMGN